MKHQQDPKVKRNFFTYISVIIHNRRKVVNKKSRSYSWPFLIGYFSTTFLRIFFTGVSDSFFSNRYDVNTTKDVAYIIITCRIKKNCSITLTSALSAG